MNCQVPHVAWSPQPSQKDEHINRRKVNEDRFIPDARLTCPSIGFTKGGTFEVITTGDEFSKPLQVDLTDHHTLPEPLFPPTSTKCGRGKVIPI